MKRKLRLIVLFTMALFLVGCNDKEKATIELATTELTVEVGAKEQIEYTVADAEKVIFTTLNEEVLTVSGTGLVEGLAVGTAVVELHLESNPKVKKTLTVNVVEPEVVITIEAEATLELYVGQTVKLQYQTNDLEGLTFEIEDETLISIDQEGNVFGLKAGTTLITLKSKTDPLVFQYIEVILEAAFIVDVEEPLVLIKGEEFLLEIEANIRGGVLFEVLDESVLTIDSNGKITPLLDGQTTVKVIAKNDENIVKELIVKVVSLLVEENQLIIEVNEEFPLSIRTNEEFGFQIADENILEVDEEGIIRGLSPGQSELVVFLKDFPEIRENVNVKVIPEIQITVPEKIVLNLGETFKLVYDSTVPVIISSPNALVVAVKAEDSLEANALGSLNVRVAAKEKPDVYQEIEVIVVELTTTEGAITIEKNEIYELEIVSSEDFVYQIEDQTIIDFSMPNKLTGLKIGKTELTITLENYPEIKLTLEITVMVEIEMTVESEIRLEVTEEEAIDYESNVDVIFTSDDSTIAEVDSEGVIKAKKSGVVNIRIAAVEKPSFYKEVRVVVVGEPTSITIVAPKGMIVHQTAELSVTARPAYGSVEATYQSLNESIVTVTEDGTITAHQVGTATIKATSKRKPSVTATTTINVTREMVVVQGAQEGDIVTYNEIEYIYGLTLFGNIEDAIDEAVKDSKIILLEGTYNELIILEKPLIIAGDGKAKLAAGIELKSDGIVVDGLVFVDDAKIYNSVPLEDVQIINNVTTSKTLTDSFIKLEGVNKLLIKGNNINLENQKAIEIIDFTEGNIIVNGNTIKGATTAVYVRANTEYDKETIFEVVWNKISDVEVAFDIDLEYGAWSRTIRSIVRFNEVDNYQTGVIASANHKVDYNLNYWGEEGPDTDNFVNLTYFDLDGYYEDPEEIVSEENYNPINPVKVYIINAVPEIFLDETLVLEGFVLPKELGMDSVNWITSDHLGLAIKDGVVTPLRTGEYTITLRAKRDLKIVDSVNITVTSLPGIELKPAKTSNNNLVGDTFMIEALVFPISIQDEAVKFESSDETIATIDETGKVTTLSPGVVTIRAYLLKDNEVEQEFTFEVFESLDSNDIFDFIISSTLTYTELLEWTVYGEGFQYKASFYESVSKLLFQDLDINRTKMIPEIFYNVRPGIKRPSPVGIPAYNTDNVQYVVVHETGNANAGAGALAHANYLMNQYLNQDSRIASWHFTVDDKEIYQHIPLDEVAWHAGDGSRVAGTTWDKGIGGGNMNGIGIETSVAYGDDIYKVWQRVAKIAASLSKDFNLPANQPRENVKFHNDFSGKICPQSMIKGGYVDYFYELVEYAYRLEYEFPRARITLTSNDPEYIDNSGRVIKQPQKAFTASYDLSVSFAGTTYPTKTFYVYLPGTDR